MSSHVMGKQTKNLFTVTIIFFRYLTVVLLYVRLRLYVVMSKKALICCYWLLCIRGRPLTDIASKQLKQVM